MTMPNFFIIGAEKSGTTALHWYLNQHPMIFMSTPKEPSFFSLVGEQLDFREPDGRPAQINKSKFIDIDAYRKLFSGVKNEKAIGEASVVYLRDPKVPERIRHYLPDAKLIAILRNPVDAAYASFLMIRSFGVEPFRNLSDALRDQDRRKRERCFAGLYIEPRFYHHHLTRYLKYFKQSQIRIYLYDDFLADNLRVIRDIFSFLEVDHCFVPDIAYRANKTGIPKNEFLHRLLTPRINPFTRRIAPYLPESIYIYLANLRNRNLIKPPLDPNLRKELTEIFREDVLRLQKLINRDLAGWLGGREDTEISR